MSLLSRNELSIFIYPQRVALQRTERRLTLAGYGRTLCARAITACKERAAGEKSWRGAMEVLVTKLPAFVCRDMEASVIISDKFMHYALVPWFDDLSDEEDRALAVNRFREMCGDAADSLAIRVSPGPQGVPSLAAAVDQELLAELETVSAQMKIRLRSIRPHFMVAYNSCRQRLEGRSAWIAVLEPNCVCLGTLQQGRLTWLRKLRIGNSWKEELPDLLERETYLAGTDTEMDEVMLWAPHLADDDMPPDGRWRIRRLSPKQGAGLVPPAAFHAIHLEAGA